jgi:predicted permease
MRSLLQDLKYALRQMRHAPGFSISVVVVLALGIGANAAMFTVLEGTLFRPLAYKEANDLVRLNNTNAQGVEGWSNVADISVWQARTHTLSAIAYHDENAAYLYADNAEQKVSAVTSSANLLGVLGNAPAMGRFFTEQEQQSGREHVVVLSDTVWRNQFHASAGIVGQTIRIDDTPTVVIGVMPRGFAFPADGSPAQVWMPAALNAAAMTRTFDAPQFQVIARRRAGVTMEAIQSELNAIQKDVLPLYGSAIASLLAPTHFQPIAYRKSLNAKDQRTALFALLGAVGALWLIACANVACLMLARTAARRREMAVRSALGAGRWRLMRQTLSESLMLSLAGGLVGLGLSQMTLRFFRHSLTTQLSPYLSLWPDARVLAALWVLSVLSAVLFAFVPARIASSVAVDQVLRQDGAQAGMGRQQNRLQRMLVVSELALTLVLLVCCGLLLRTVFALKQVPLGFRTDHVFAIEPRLPEYKYAKLDPNTTVYKPLLEKLKAIPGVQSAAITTLAPLNKGFTMRLTLDMGKRAKGGAPSAPITANMRAAGPELQQVLGFRMLRGRYFNEQDTPDGQLVAVVNSAFARLYEARNASVDDFSISMKTSTGEPPRSFKIVGVIDDFHQVGVAEAAAPEIDLNAAQMKPTDGFYQSTLKAHSELMLRSSRDAKSLEPELHHVMQELTPDLADAEIRTMDQIVEDAMGSQILAAHLLEALGGLALIVALAGLYSLLAYLVTLRTRELGLRLALGAQREDILSLVLRGAGVLLVAGTLAGVGISLLAVRLLHSFLFGVKQNDVPTLVSASLLLLVVGAFAAWLPARRASRLEPMEALRTE